MTPKLCVFNKEFSLTDIACLWHICRYTCHHLYPVTQPYGATPIRAVARLMAVIKNITVDLESPLKHCLWHFCSYITGEEKSCGQAGFKEAQIYNLPTEPMTMHACSVVSDSLRWAPQKGEWIFLKKNTKSWAQLSDWTELNNFPP